MNKETPMPAASHETSGVASARRWEKRIDLSSKILLGMLGIVLPIMAGCYQRQHAALSLLLQREQAESSLRATMFSDLLTSLVGTAGQGLVPIEREQLVVELLALNFDEHFAIKPLFEEVDRRLVCDVASGSNPSAAAQAREEIRSIARRVSDRQVAGLVAYGRYSHGSLTGGAVQDLLFTAKEPKPSEAGLMAGSEEGEMGSSLNVDSPDGEYYAAVTVDSCDGYNQIAYVELVIYAIRQGVQSVDSQQMFRLSWFDFPLTDNLLFRDGNRLALVLKRLEPDESAVALRLIWFPRDYVAPGERPANFREVSELIGRRT